MTPLHKRPGYLAYPAYLCSCVASHTSCSSVLPRHGAPYNDAPTYRFHSPYPVPYPNPIFGWDILPILPIYVPVWHRIHPANLCSCVASHTSCSSVLPRHGAPWNDAPTCCGWDILPILTIDVPTVSLGAPWNDAPTILRPGYPAYPGHRCSCVASCLSCPSMFPFCTGTKRAGYIAVSCSSCNMTPTITGPLSGSLSQGDRLAVPSV